jgi:hypothetical protein
MDIQLLTTEFCVRAHAVRIDGRTEYDRFFYADASDINTEHVLYHAQPKYNRISEESLNGDPIAFISDALKILIENQANGTGLYDPFSCCYCKESFSPSTPPLTQEFGIRLFEISKQDFEQISY